MAGAKVTRSNKKLKNCGNSSPNREKNTAEDVQGGRDKGKKLMQGLIDEVLRNELSDANPVFDQAECSSNAGSLSIEDIVEHLGSGEDVSPLSARAVCSVLKQEDECVKDAGDEARIYESDAALTVGKGLYAARFTTNAEDNAVVLQDVGMHDGDVDVLHKGGQPGKPEVRVSFREALTANNNPGYGAATSFFAPKMVDIKERAALTQNIMKNDVVILSHEAYSRRRIFHQHDLIGRVYGNSLQFAIIAKILTRIWGHLSEFRVMELPFNCFCLYFDSVEDRNKIWLGGPWQVAGQAMGLDLWEADFKPSPDAAMCAPVWIRFPVLPLLYWDVENIIKIAKNVGEPILLDGWTAQMQRTSYARVCVRMDLTKSLKSGLWLSGDLGKSFQPIEYEGLPHICYACGHVGHVVEHCPKKKMETETVKNTATNTGREELRASNGSIFVESPAVVPPCAPPAQTQDMHADETVREGLGPWMVVQPRKRRPIWNTNDHQNTGQRSHAVDSTVRGIKREEGRDRIAIRRRRSASIVRGREPIQRSWAPMGVTRSASNNRHELLTGDKGKKAMPVDSMEEDRSSSLNDKHAAMG